MDTVMRPILSLSLAVFLLLGGFAAAPAPAAKSGAGLTIERIHLGFEDRQARRNVARREEGLRVFADIDYAGSGLFEACWMVDGKFFADIAQHLSGIGTVRLASPETPGLPTIAEGLHIVTLVVGSHAGDVQPTRVGYFVTTDIKSVGLPIILTSPADESAVDLFKQPFTWENHSTVNTYLIEFIDEDPNRPVMSAFTEDRQYTVPAPVARHRFLPGKTYFWQVKGFSADHKLVTKSFARQFQTIGG